MKSRLYGGVAIYKPLLDRTLLTDETDGVTYFKKTMRPHFVKGTQIVFLLRVFSFSDAIVDKWIC